MPFARASRKRGRNNGYGYAGAWRNTQTRRMNSNAGFRSANSLARSIGRGGGSSVARAVKREFDKRVEWKHFVTNQAAVTVTKVGAVVGSSGVAQGPKDTERIGDSLRATSMDIKWGVEGNAAGPQCQAVRCILVVWNTNVAPTIASVITIVAGIETMAIYNTDNAEQYKVLYDRTVVVSANVANSKKCTGQIRRKIRIPEHLRDMKFSAASTTGTHKLYWLQISNETTNPPSIDSTFRLNYSDS